MGIFKNEEEYILEKSNSDNINDDPLNLIQVCNTDKNVGSNLEQNNISKFVINKISPISNINLTVAANTNNNFKLRKQSFNQINSNMPLEIINELNGEGQIVLTNTEGIILKSNKGSKENSFNVNLENKEFNLDSKAKNLIKGQKRIKFMIEEDDEEGGHRNDDIYENVNFEFNNFNSSHNSARIGKSKLIELMKSNNINQNKNPVTKSSDKIKPKYYKTKLNKPEDGGENNLKLKNEISKIIIPLKFLKMKNDEMILLHGEFLKLSNDGKKNKRCSKCFFLTLINTMLNLTPTIQNFVYSQKLNLNITIQKKITFDY